MESPTGVIPEEMMDRRRKGDVIRLLQSLPLTGDLKRRYLEGWKMTVGASVSALDYQKVERTGIDAPGSK